ncbi:Hypothetical protein D082_29490 [Synechocystis sp. PCC 6714]|nr:Hypothetical protein D082_29490 [Synechocystis sp. PCC 6714]
MASMATFPKTLNRWFQSVCLGALTAIAVQLPGKTAENIFFTYGPVKLTVRVASLERFVQDGTVDSNLGFLFNLVGASEEKRTKLREIMGLRAEVDPVVLSNFFNTSLGEDALARAAFILNAPWGSNSKYGIRAAIVQAAQDPEGGLSLINFIKKYPTDIHFQGEVVEERARAVQLLVKASEHFIDKMIALSEIEAASEGEIDFSVLPDPTEMGPYGVAPKQTWWLTDGSRNRRFYVDVYRPQRWKPGKTPVIVFSHGLASRPEDFDNAAEKMASYGFLVALPQHPGSDILQAQALLNRTSRQGYYPTEFIDRPKDISYVIDELGRRNASEFGDRLNLTEVGVGGHSFGGYGALAVAGATIDWEFLESECRIGQGVPNTALLLQCDALTLPRSDYDFRDPRVVAVLAANPVNSAIFGVSGLHKVTVPVLLLGGSYDPATPFVLEQARSFPRLASRDKYLTLMEGQAHVDFSKIDANIKNVVESVEAVSLKLPDPNLLHTYGSAVMVPFFQLYVAGDESFRPLVENGAAHAAYLSRDQQFKFYLISQKSEGALIKEINQFRRTNGLTPPPNEFPSQTISDNF